MQSFTTIADQAIVLGQSRDRIHNVYRHLVHPDLMPETRERFRVHLSESLALIGLFAPLLRSAGYSTEEVRGITKAVGREMRQDTEWILVTEKGGVEVIDRQVLGSSVGDFLASYSRSGTDLKLFNLGPLRAIAKAAIDLTMRRYFPDGVPPQTLKGSWAKPKAMVAFERSQAKKKKVRVS